MPTNPLESGLGKALVDDIVRKRCIPFVGAGFSNNAKNQKVPCYRELADMLSQYLPDDVRSERCTPERVFEMLVQVLGDQWVQAKVCEIVGHAEPGDAHQYFAEIDWDYVVTTNYDRLLEKSFHACGLDPIVCTSDQDLHETMSNGARETADPVIVKIHGDCTRKRAMVVRPSFLDEAHYTLERPAQFRFLKEHLGARSAVFIGYSLHDPEIQYLRKVVEVTAKEQRLGVHKDYILVIDPTDVELDKLHEDKMLMVIPLYAERYGITKSRCMAEFLRNLRDRTRAARTPRNARVGGISWRLDDTGQQVRLELDDIRSVSEAGESRWLSRVLVVAAPERLEQWAQFIMATDATRSLAVLAVSVEDCSRDGDCSIGEYMASPTGTLGVCAAVIDYTGWKKAAAHAFASLRGRSVEPIPVAEDPAHVPPKIYPFGPFTYERTELESTTSRLAQNLAPLIRTLVFHKAVEDLTASRDHREDDAIVLEGFRVLEGAMRYLCQRVAASAGVAMPDTTKIFKMVDFLHEHEAKYALTIDEGSLGPVARLRNAVAHEGKHASAADADLVLRVTSDFIRFNIGPNVGGFDVARELKPGGEGA
jgi:hypothetical protein